MSQMIVHLAQILQLPNLDIPWQSNWDIPWVGIGGFLLGLGSALSGYAAIMTARTNIKKSTNENTEEHPNA